MRVKFADEKDIDVKITLEQDGDDLDVYANGVPIFSIRPSGVLMFLGCSPRCGLPLEGKSGKVVVK